MTAAIPFSTLYEVRVLKSKIWVGELKIYWTIKDLNEHLEDVQRQISYWFDNVDLLFQALTRRSYYQDNGEAPEYEFQELFNGGFVS